MPLTASPIMYVFTCLPKMASILADEVYDLLTIASEFSVTVFKLSQPVNVLFSIPAILLGIVIALKLLYP